MLLRHALLFLLAALLAPAALAQSTFINEVHYDNAGADEGEFVEVAVPDGVDVSTLTLTFYNGSNGTEYASVAGADFTEGSTSDGYTFYTASPSSIQNGSPDGLALSSSVDGLIQFLSYEGEFTASGGPADGQTSTDIGIEETGDTPIGDSLQLTGSGASYPDFTWTGPLAASPGTINAGQTFGGMPAPETFTALVRGSNEVPANESGARGGATITIDGSTLSVTGAFAYLESDYAAAHLHGGAAGANGPVVFGLTAMVDGDSRGGVFTAADNTFENIRSTFADSVRAGLVYINIHTSGSPSGEIRGQFGTGDDDLPFDLSGGNEVPPVTTSASGFGTVNVDGTTMTVTGSFMGLMGNYAASHVHAGAVGANGGVVQGLAPTVDGDSRGGTFEAGMNTFEVRSTFADSLRAGLAYVNIHSSMFGSGELRGQISFEGDGPPVITLAEARAEGVGATVRVQGTVSRAMGAFTYIQDATGGLTIRQTSGAFFDAVAAGTIAAGTQLDLSGTLSEFRTLLQINGGDLDEFEILGDTDVPEAQTVTLSELAANGEDYESELVIVESVVFADTGVFAASTTYMITDPTDMTNAVALRVGGENDTGVDGTDIPTEAVDVAAIVGQFDGAYQLQPINESDIGADGIANETSPEDGLALTVPNPVGENALVRYSVGAAESVRLVVFDALGREVATLVEAEVAAGAHTAAWDASGLAPGVYVLRLGTEAGGVTRTVTVVR